jgi:hypothetical protein
MTGPQMTTALAWLASHLVDSLVVDGSHLVSQDHRYEWRDDDDGSLIVHMLCSDNEGTTHMLEFNPIDHTAPVQHVVLGKLVAE